ncbi:MAG TPA: VOC family protein [Aldersonia sp.]
MLADSKGFSGFSVDDLDAARRFYGEVLGLPITEHEMGLIGVRIAPDTDVLVYPKGDAHQAATFTVLNFPVRDIDATVDELTARGVEFERYDGFGQDAKGIARGPEGPAIAWFTDPAGNILSVLEE